MRKLLTFLIALASPMKRFLSTLILLLLVLPASAQVPMTGGGLGKPAAGGGRSCTDDTASTNFIARLTGSPSNTLLDAYCVLIKGLESDGIITGNLSGTAGCGSVLDVLGIFATNTSTNAKLNLCGTNYPFTYNGTPAESSQFAANLGYTGDGSTVYLDTAYNISTGPNWGLNSASHVGVHPEQRRGQQRSCHGRPKWCVCLHPAVYFGQFCL